MDSFDKKSINRTVIMLSGWMQSGKDTVGDFLVKHFAFCRFAFADVLKDEVSEMFQISRASLDTTEGKCRIFDKSTGRTVRDVLIDHGQARRAENADYWVNRVIATIEKREKDLNIQINRIVITDWRFPNEYHVMKRWIDEQGGEESSVYAWRVNRWREPPLLDPTELALDDFTFDVVLNCDQGVPELQSIARDEMYSLQDPNVRLFLTDIDEVLLKWIEGFSEFAKTRGYVLNNDYPEGWILSEWLRDSSGSPLNPAEIQNLVLQFNHSDHFGDLDPCDGTHEALHFIKSCGYHVVGISSCTDDVDALEKRKRNLVAHFGGNIDHVVCLPLGACKKDVLRKFPPSIWIDDNPDNAVAGIDVGHFGFVMKRPWNAAQVCDNDGSLPVFDGWKDVMDYVTMEDLLMNIDHSLINKEQFL